MKMEFAMGPSRAESLTTPIRVYLDRRSGDDNSNDRVQCRVRDL